MCSVRVTLLESHERKIRRSSAAGKSCDVAKQRVAWLQLWGCTWGWGAFPGWFDGSKQEYPVILCSHMELGRGQGRRMWLWGDGKMVDVGWERFPNSHFSEKGEGQAYLPTVIWSAKKETGGCSSSSSLTPIAGWGSHEERRRYLRIGLLTEPLSFWLFLQITILNVHEIC